MIAKIPPGLHDLLGQVRGYIYPNEIEIHWSILIVVYPYLTGLVAGAFILASLVKIFDVKTLQPTYRLSLLTALAFLLVAPFPLLLHLGHPERSFEIFLTPHLTSAMAVFGFVYAWYLMGVLLLEIWFEYRRDLVVLGRNDRSVLGFLRRAIALFSTDVRPESVAFDRKAVRAITVIGIPSAFLLHGYVGFIFGSVKANPWWGSVLMPIVFLMSAIVSGIAIVLLLYMILAGVRNQRVDMACLDSIGSYLFYAVIVDFSLEALDFIHRLYQSEESVGILSQLISLKLFMNLVVIQILLGMVVPLGILVLARSQRANVDMRKLLYFVAALLIQLGIFSTRWNVVIGGQLFSKSFRGLMTYKMETTGIEGLMTAIALLIAPFVILAVLVRIFPTYRLEEGPPPSVDAGPKPGTVEAPVPAA
jgi:Ni/Fe-hydrogenase subunit HybB-like protein